jgi:hypothetical protein
LVDRSFAGVRVSQKSNAVQELTESLQAAQCYHDPLRAGINEELSKIHEAIARHRLIGSGEQPSDWLLGFPFPNR